MTHAGIIDPLLLGCVQISTSANGHALTGASGFFFERDRRLFLITSGHVLRDEASGHRPDRAEIGLHTDPDNLAASAQFSIPLYDHGRSVWRQATDSAGNVDVAAIEIRREALPASSRYWVFSPADLPAPDQHIMIGSALLVIGFPLGFHDTLHHMPVARAAILASPYGLRFQGQGYFLTDARTHRGSSGAPVVARIEDATGALSWTLLGIHSGRLEMAPRDHALDEALGLNCAWYADILLTLTED